MMNTISKYVGRMPILVGFFRGLRTLLRDTPVSPLLTPMQCNASHAMQMNCLKSVNNFNLTRYVQCRISQSIRSGRVVHHTARGVLRVKVTGLPAMLTQMVRGSFPIFSVLKPCVFVTEPGTVTGMVVLHVLPVVETLMPVMVALLPVMLVPFVPVPYVQTRLGLQASRAMRAVKAAAICEGVRLGLGGWRREDLHRHA
jgi:hypothetical protein